MPKLGYTDQIFSMWARSTRGPARELRALAKSSPESFEMLRYRYSEVIPHAYLRAGDSKFRIWQHLSPTCLLAATLKHVANSGRIDFVLLESESVQRTFTRKLFALHEK